VKNILLPLIAFLLGFGGVLGYQYVHAQTTNENITSPVGIQTTPEAPLTLVPPSEAVSGILTITAGNVEKFSRGETEYKEASSGAKILLGESIATKENSDATTEVAGIVSANLNESSKLVFANLFPENMVLQQKNGKILYKISKQLSVRALHTLITMDPGEVTINIIDTDISITVKTGSVKFALVDTDDNTHVWDLQAGQRANIDDAARTVEIASLRSQ